MSVVMDIYANTGAVGRSVALWYDSILQRAFLSGEASQRIQEAGPGDFG